MYEPATLGELLKLSDEELREYIEADECWQAIAAAISAICQMKGWSRSECIERFSTESMDIDGDPTMAIGSERLLNRLFDAEIIKPYR